MLNFFLNIFLLTPDAVYLTTTLSKLPLKKKKKDTIKRYEINKN